VNRLLLMMNFCTFKNISVIRVFVKSVEPNNNKSVFKLIGKFNGVNISQSCCIVTGTM
jgi:hypothetical protein